MIEIEANTCSANNVELQKKPPVKPPPNRPKKPPVKEPQDPPQPPLPPDEPPVKEPPNEPEEPPVKEPPPKDPDRDPPRKPPMRVQRFQCSSFWRFAYRSELIAHGLEAGRPKSRQTDGDEVFEHPSFPALRPY